VSFDARDDFLSGFVSVYFPQNFLTFFDSLARDGGGLA
jgi:hypothetical protein